MKVGGRGRVWAERGERVGFFNLRFLFVKKNYMDIGLFCKLLFFGD